MPENNRADDEGNESRALDQQDGDGGDVPPELERLADENPRAMARIVQTQVSGPLPAASEFAAYEDTLPGSADRILAMAEQQGEHRRRVTEENAANDRRLSSRGQLLGALLLLVIVVCATIGGILGGGLVAAAIASPGVVLLIVFGLFSMRSPS